MASLSSRPSPGEASPGIDAIIRYSEIHSAKIYIESMPPYFNVPMEKVGCEQFISFVG